MFYSIFTNGSAYSIAGNQNLLHLVPNADPAGATGCVRCLVNDLDLSVTKNDGSRVYYPNGRGNKDSINNVERVIVPASEGDNMRITIEAANLDRSEQPFALYLTGCFGSRAYSGDAQPTGQGMDRNTKIIVIVCSIVGFLLLFLAGMWMWDTHQRKKHREARQARAAKQPKPQSRVAHDASDENSHHGNQSHHHNQQRQQQQPTGRY